MYRASPNRIKLVLFLILAICAIVLGDTRGKIAGTVINSSDRAPMAGVNVFIQEEQLGAITDEYGRYAILNVPPGLHSVSASFIGFKTSTVQGVQVVSDQTSNLDFALETAVLEGEEVFVTAERPLIQPDLTSSKSIITEQDLKILPAETFQGLLNTKAGVTVGAGGALHVRGGRSSEVLYLVDGIPVPNPFSSAMGLSIATNMIAELTLISGTFNAEYGKAMSGIVNLVTRDGGSSYEGNVRFQTGDMYSSHTDIMEDIDEFEPFNRTRMDLSFGGPVPLLPNASFILAGTYRKSDGWLYGWREHTTFDFASFTTGQNAFILMTGDSSRVALNPSESYNLMGKVSLKPWSSAKLTYQFNGTRSNRQEYEHQWKFNPDGRYQYQDSDYLHALHFSQTLSSGTYFTIKGAVKNAHSEQFVHKLKTPYNWDERTYYDGGDISDHDLNGDGYLGEITIDWNFLRDNGGFIPNPTWYTLAIEFPDTTFYIDVPRYVPNNNPPRTEVPDDHFVYGGQHTAYYLSNHRTTTLKFDLTSQVTPTHQLRTGVETNFYRLHSNSINIQMSGVTFWQPYIQPASTSGPGHSEYVREPFDFSAYLQDKIELKTIIMQIGVRFDYFDSRDSTFTDKTNPVRNKAATPKHQLSPRLGVSFPITDQGYIHFSYGHFFQMPPFTYLYRNPNLKRYAGTILQYGNPDLSPQKTIMYELGLQQQLSYTTAVDITLFYRNILNWLSSEYNFINNDYKYTRYITEDYGNVRGVTVALVQRTNVGMALNFDYTFEFAEGNGSSPDEAYYDNLRDPPIESEKKVVPLDWDVRHTANATVSYRTQRGLGISFISKFSSGLPYTPTIQGLRWAEENSGRKPIHLTSDLQMFKTFQLAGHDITASLKLYNLFDRLNERYVFTDTGRSTYSLKPTYAGDPAEHYKGLPGIHSIYENLYSPTNYRPPRQVLFSLGWSF